MQTELETEAATLTLGFADRKGLAGFAADLLERQAFLVRLDRELKLRSGWEVVLSAPGVRFSCHAEVVQRFDTVSGAVGTAFELRDWNLEKAELLRGLLRTPAADGAASGVEDQDQGDVEVDDSETLGISPIHTIRELNPSQRSILAMKAGRQERQILLRDTSPQVLQSLLSNPRLEAKEVLALVQSNQATAAILQRAAGDARWGKNQEIRTAVARNPKTPSPLAVRLMETLRTSDLRRMAKMSGGLRENVRRAALREYLKRTQSG